MFLYMVFKSFMTSFYRKKIYIYNEKGVWRNLRNSQRIKAWLAEKKGTLTKKQILHMALRKNIWILDIHPRKYFKKRGSWEDTILIPIKVLLLDTIYLLFTKNS